MNSKDNTAALPAQAFAEARPNELLLGTLFNFRGNWAMRVAYSESQTDQAFLILQGSHAGHVYRMDKGMPRALCIAKPFTWFATIDLDDPADHEALRTASMAIAENGPLIVGGGQDGDHVAFDLAGQPWEDYHSQAALKRFDRWGAQLALNERPFHSLGVLFSVDRRVGRDSAQS